MPPTSLVVPLLGKYLVFTIQMVSLSIFLTIFTINIHNRTPSLHNKMPELVRNIFLNHLARFLLVNKEKKFINSCLDRKYYDFKALQDRAHPRRQSAYRNAQKIESLRQFSMDTQAVKSKVVACLNKRINRQLANSTTKQNNGTNLLLGNKKILNCLEDVVSNIDLEIETRIVSWKKF